jgi:hypothetical protein
LDGGWWIGWIEEVPGVNWQEATREELVESLRVTLRPAHGSSVSGVTETWDQTESRLRRLLADFRRFGPIAETVVPQDMTCHI